MLRCYLSHSFGHQSLTVPKGADGLAQCANLCKCVHLFMALDHSNANLPEILYPFGTELK